MFKKYKLIRQENIKDCGAACLLNIIKMYGGNNSLERIRNLIKTDKNGTVAFNLIEGAKKLGFEAKGFRCNSLQDINPLPCIAHVIINKSLHHYLVIQKIDMKNKTLLVSDPAFGNKKYSFDEFGNIWTKIIISLKPKGKMESINTNRQMLKLLLGYIKPHTKALTIIFVFSIIYIVFSIVNAIYLKIIVDNYITSMRDIYYIFLFFIFVVIVKTISDYLRNRLLIFINMKIDEALIINTFKHIISLPYSYFSSRHTGDIISRMSDLSYVRELISRVSFMLWIDLIIITFALIILYLINNILFFLSLIIILIYLFIVYIYSPIIKKYIVLNQEIRAEVNSYLIESISGIETIKNLNIEKNIIDKLKVKYTKLLECTYNFEKIYNIQKNIKDIIIYFGFNALLFLGSLLILEKKITVGELILFNSLLIYFLGPLKNIFDLEPLLKNAASSIQRISELFEVEADDITGPGDYLKGDIIFSNLTFSYNNVHQILENVNLHIREKEKVIIIGESGCGKSTLAKLLMRYYEVNNNAIMINNVDINSYNLKTIRDRTCYVSQKEILFTDSLYNNIVMDRSIGDKEVIDICQLTHIDKIINKHNFDYHFLIEENGSNMSGGERQRIIMARSLLKDADIYIFDESMNEVNLVMERKIMKNIISRYNNKTIIVISHRLENIDLYDQVITFNNKTIKVKRKENECKS
jgi:ATP-binding cassette, subfamily C, bacteriocin exporter